MQKTSRILTLAAFLAGGSLGYFFLFPTLAQNDASSVKETSSEKHAPGLKMVRRSTSGEHGLPSRNTLTQYLLKYAEFSPEETRRELERLLKAGKDEKHAQKPLYEAIRYLAFKLANQSPEEAKRLMENKSAVERYDLYSTILEGWAAEDFQGAMGYLLAHKNETEDSVHAFKAMTMNLAIKDAGQALKWLSSLTPGERITALHVLACAIPQYHPEKTGELLVLLSAEELFSHSLGITLASSWAVSDWEAFKSWADTLKMNQKKAVLSRALQILGKTDLAKATEIFKKIDRKNNTEMGQAIISGMGYRDLNQGKALDWVLNNRDSLSDPSGMIRHSVSQNCPPSRELISKVLQMQEGGDRDSALSGLVNIQSFTLSITSGYDIPFSFMDILSLSEKIGNAEARNNAIRECVEKWIYKSPEEARHWITDKSSFSPEEKQQLLQECDKKNRSLKIRL